MIKRRLSVLRQWSKEKIRSKEKTEPSDEFVALEQDLKLRYSGTRSLHQSMAAYVKWLCKRRNDREQKKSLPLACVSMDMIHHGNQWPDQTDYRECLVAMGEIDDRLARAQEAFAANINSCWLESLERSLDHMRSAFEARRIMESKRLAFDAARARALRLKGKDPKAVDEVHELRETYEEEHEKVLEVMIDIKEAESDTLHDLYSFLEAQLAYHERCVNVLRQSRDDWPVERPAEFEDESTVLSTEPRYRHARSMASTADRLGSNIGTGALMTDDATMASISVRGSSDLSSEDGR